MILSYIILVLSSFSFLLGISYLKDDIKSKKNWYYFLVTLGSTIWGLGFGFLLIQTDEVGALYCRAFGMIGVFLFAIFGVKVATTIANTPDKLRKISSFLSYFGFVLYPFVILPARQNFHMERFGMSYTFTNDIWNTLYNVYSVVILVLFLIILIKMRKDADCKRQKVLNNGLWMFFISFSLGSVLDTVFPMIGVGAFPGSTLTQFVAIFIVYYALMYEKKNSLDIDSVSKHIYHSLDLPILVLNKNMKIDFVSDGACKYFNITKGKEKDTDISNLFVLESENSIYSIISKSISKECFVRNNNYYCSFSVDAIKDSFEDIVGYVIIVTDLTEKNKFIKELEEAKDTVEQASKSKDNFLANMSHEIRTPLNAIIGINELIMCEEDKNKVNEYAGQISVASKNLLGMVDDLFDFSKIQTGKLDIIDTEYNFVEMVKDVIHTYKGKLNEKELAYNVSVANSIPKVLLGDEKRVKQCVVNLVKNAIKYTDSGNISLKIYSDKVLGDDINLVVEVTDTGLGIKKEDIDNIFKSFSNLESSNNRLFEGTGLGLTIVKRLMILMNGTLEIESEYGIGSKFILSFPQKIINKEESGGLILNNLDKKIFVFDDRSVDIAILKKLLFKNKYIVDSENYQTADIPGIIKMDYDYIFCNYDKSLNIDIDDYINRLNNANVVCLVDDYNSCNNKLVLKKPVSEVDLKNLFDGIDVRTNRAIKLVNNENNSKKLSLTNVRILAVDDNKINLMVLSGLLKNTEATIDLCYSGIDALKMVENSKYDIIFLDHMMPGMDGVETFSRIKGMDRDWVKEVPIIVVTANAVDGADNFYLEKGFNDYISKPVDVDVLNDVLVKHLPEDLIEYK